MKFRSKNINGAWLIEFKHWLLPFLWIATPMVFKSRLEAQQYVYERNKEYGHESK